MFRQFTPVCYLLPEKNHSLGRQVQRGYTKGKFVDQKKVDDDLRQWYKDFRPEKIPREPARIKRESSKLTIEYPLDKLCASMPLAIQQKVRTSIFARGSNGHNDVFEIFSDIKGDRDSDAWDTLAMALHSAARAAIGGTKTSLHRMHPNMKETKLEALSKLEVDHQKKLFSELDDDEKRVRHEERKNRALERSAKKAVRLSPGTQSELRKGDGFWRGWNR